MTSLCQCIILSIKLSDTAKYHLFLNPMVSLYFSIILLHSTSSVSSFDINKAYLDVGNEECCIIYIMKSAPIDAHIDGGTFPMPTL